MKEKLSELLSVVNMLLIVEVIVNIFLFLCNQQIWIDIGETEAEKDRMLIELEIECLEVYRRKVDEAANAKARLHQSVAAKEAELATLMASLGDLTIHSAVKFSFENKQSFACQLLSCFYLSVLAVAC